MLTERANSLVAFKHFIDVTLTNGGAEVTLDEALTLWEYENTPEVEREETLNAIQRGFEDMDAGRTVDAFAFADRMRQQLQTSVET